MDVGGARVTGVAYRAGIVGTGFMGSVHARAIRTSGGSVAGVVGSDPRRSAVGAAALGTTPFDDLDALLADDSIDVVHVCTPNHLHAPHAAAAIAAGKHVVCEKPLATDLTAAADLAAGAAAGGVVGTVPFVYRFHPMVREARRRIADGGLGRLSLAHGGYLQDWLLRPSDDDWRVDARRGGATRAFGDIGSHWCDLLEFTTQDRITAVAAQLATPVGRRPSGPVDTDDVATISFATTGGMVGTAILSQVSAGRKNRLFLEISGSEGTVAFDQELPEQLWVGGRDANVLLLRDPTTLSADAARYSTLPAGHAQGYQDCFDHFVADTAAAIGGATVDGLPHFADGVRAATIAEAVVASAAKRAWVEIADTDAATDGATP